MIDPGEALGTSAQVAVTLAGFAGVVVVFGKRTVHEWSQVDKFRLRLLLTFSALPLAFAVIGMLFLATSMPDPVVWQWCSVVVFLLLLGIAVGLARTFTAFARHDLENAGASRSIFYGGMIAGFAMTLLQLFNVFVWCDFWPFFAAIVLSILASTLQFVRLILNRREWT